MSHNQTDRQESVNQQPEALTRMTSRLFARVSHDFGTPLSALRGYVKMVVDGRAGPLTDVQREYLTIALESADRLCALANRVSKIPDFIDRLHAEALDVRAEWEATVNARKAKLQEKTITVTGRSSGDRLVVAADRKQLRQVFERVLDLSIESAQPGSEILAEFSHGKERDIALRICLSGDGIPTSADFSTVHNIVFLHGGTLSLVAQTATGSICIINLPEAA
jgi:signal transduction histidine kinase